MRKKNREFQRNFVNSDNISQFTQFCRIATTGVMPSANGALSKLLCSCYHPKQERGVVSNETADRYEVVEKEHVDQGEPREEPRRDTAAKVESRDEKREKVEMPANATEQVTTPIIEEIVEDQVCHWFQIDISIFCN